MAHKTVSLAGATIVSLMAAVMVAIAWNPPVAARSVDASLLCANGPGCPTPTPLTAFITITTPSMTELPRDSRAFEVAGTARGLSDAQIVVRARDRGHRIIDEQIAIVE
ncbi:MAG: hypothetical protein KDE31_06735, partial [Caldilineaceae bacterium]|nr:hypothetical protein [Caldilineaceae bacterium]